MDNDECMEIKHGQHFKKHRKTTKLLSTTRIRKPASKRNQKGQQQDCIPHVRWTQATFRRSTRTDGVLQDTSLRDACSMLVFTKGQQGNEGIRLEMRLHQMPDGSTTTTPNNEIRNGMPQRKERPQATLRPIKPGKDHAWIDQTGQNQHYINQPTGSMCHHRHTHK